MDYLKKEFGLQSIQIHRLDRGANNLYAEFEQTSVVSRRNNFADFVKKSQDETEGGRYMYYIKGEMIVSKNLQQDYIKPGFIANLVRNRNTGITIWSDFNRKPEFKERERYFCVVQGQETFRVVSPIYK